ncbi:MAG TPA: hypothetical protein VMM84_13385 [Pyrinomonadaceae bacterium]|nr:hypothetical protein [Pyrinomonadaceae bacterium]
MSKIWIVVLTLSLGLISAVSIPVSGQENSSTLTPTEEEQQKEKAESEKRAFSLLEQLVNESQLLRLSENRIRVQLGAADLLWQTDEGRARSLFMLAAEGVSQLMQAPETNQRRQPRASSQLRQELVMTAAKHDAQLAYQVLDLTRPPATASQDPRQLNMDNNLDQLLLARIAALDPKLALQNAEQMLEKGEFPRTLANVLAQLQLKDPPAATKLSDKVVSKLGGTNMLSNFEAGNLALALLQPGPRIADASSAGSAPGNRAQVLSLSAYQNLLGTVVDAALKANASAAVPQRGNPNNARRRLPSGPATVASGAPTDGQLEQNNARRLLNGLQALLPQIDQHLPARGQAVRQKMGELGVGNNRRAGFNQLFSALQQGTADSMITAAAAAPPAVQSRIYQQAAMRALEEGDPDRARQIANDHLDGRTRETVLRNVEFRLIADQAASNSIEEIRQKLSAFNSDDERINFLLQLAGTVQQKDTEFALQILDETRQYTSRRATNYQQLEQHLRIAEALRQLDPSRSFEVLEPGIMLLNELLAAAVVLNGFEVNIFRDGELPLQGGSNLTNTIARYGAAIGTLAKSDFERAQALADRFQLTEPRVMVRLSIVRSMLGVETPASRRSFRLRGADQNTFIFRQP